MNLNNTSPKKNKYNTYEEYINGYTYQDYVNEHKNYSLSDFKNEYDVNRMTILENNINYSHTLIDYMDENDDITDYNNLDNEYYDDLQKQEDERNKIYEEQLQEEEEYYNYINGYDNDYNDYNDYN
jgi:hypothetical protein